MKTNLGKTFYICFRNIHISKNTAIYCHGCFMNLISTVALVSQVLLWLIWESSRRNTRNWQPPFLILSLSNPTKWAWMWTTRIPWCAPLLRVPKFIIMKAIKYFLQKIFMCLSHEAYGLKQSCHIQEAIWVYLTMSMVSSFRKAGRLI